MDLLSDLDAVYSDETPFEILGTPMKTCLICTGTAVNTCWIFWQSQLFQVRTPPSVDKMAKTLRKHIHECAL